MAAAIRGRMAVPRENQDEEKIIRNFYLVATILPLFRRQNQQIARSL
jgi:hypothetical protein